MGPAEVAIIIVALIGAMSGMASLYVAIRKTPVEIESVIATAQQTQANTFEKYVQIASMTADENLELQTRVKKLEQDLDLLHDELYKAITRAKYAERRAEHYEKFTIELAKKMEVAGLGKIDTGFSSC